MEPELVFHIKDKTRNLWLSRNSCWNAYPTYFKTKSSALRALEKWIYYSTSYVPDKDKAIKEVNAILDTVAVEEKVLLVKESYSITREIKDNSIVLSKELFE